MSKVHLFYAGTKRFSLFVAQLFPPSEVFPSLFAFTKTWKGCGHIWTFMVHERPRDALDFRGKE